FVFVTGALLSEEIARYLKASGCPTLIKPIRADEVYALLGDPEGSPRISRTLGPHSSSTPPEEPAESLADARDSFAQAPPAQARPPVRAESPSAVGEPPDRDVDDDHHRDSVNEPVDAAEPEAREREAQRLRARRTAVTPVARP